MDYSVTTGIEYIIDLSLKIYGNSHSDENTFLYISNEKKIRFCNFIMNSFQSELVLCPNFMKKTNFVLAFFYLMRSQYHIGPK